MYKVEYHYSYGPFNGRGGYGGGSGFGMSKSVKTATKRAIREHAKLGEGGGVPIFYYKRIWKDGKLLGEYGDLDPRKSVFYKKAG